MFDTECKQSVPLFAQSVVVFAQSDARSAFSMKQRNLVSKPALNVGKKFYFWLRKPLCTNAAWVKISAKT